MIALRRSSDAFRKASMADVNRDVTLITQAGQGDIQKDDLIIGYQTIASNGIATLFLSMRIVKRAPWSYQISTVIC